MSLLMRLSELSGVMVNITAYEELSRDLPNIQFIAGLPEDWSDLIDPDVKNLLILDDLMSECGNDPEVTKLFTRGSHHLNVSMINIVQNLFHQSKESWTVSLNRFMVEAYADATSQPYSYLFIDLKPNCPEEWRLRTGIFPGDTMYAYAYWITSSFVILTRRLMDNVHTLHVLNKSSAKKRKAILKNASKELVTCLCECALNIIKGKVPLTPGQKKKLAKHKIHLRTLSDKKVPHFKRKRLLIQKGGF